MSWGKNSSRNFQFDRPSTPSNVGPGSYEIEPATARRPQSAAFKNREKRSTPFDRKKNEIPPPGKYNPIDANTHLQISSSFKSNSERNIYDLNDNPSPADHSVILEWGSKKRREVPETVYDKPFSTYVGQNISGFDILEDGTLRPKKIKKKDPKWIGPGTYNIENTYNNGHSMKQAYRDIDPSNKAKIPGPGEYDTRIQFGCKPKTSYKSRVRPSSVTSSRKRYGDKDPSDSAPKGYELQHQPWNKEEQDISASYFKSKSKREIFVVKERTPAPTNYQNTKRKQPEMAKAAFGQRTPRFLDYDGNHVPGPGAYDHDDGAWVILSSNYNGFTGRRAYDTYNPGNGVPGPGTYETKSIWDRNKKKDRPNSVFASNVPRDKVFGDSTPGPGAYTINSKPKKNGKISIHSSRSKKVNNFFQSSSRENPAPDAYYTDRSLGNNMKTIPKDSKFEKQNRYPTPGPGTYNVEHSSLIKKSYNSDLIGVV